MELWVRSKDREDLVKVDKLEYRRVGNKHGITCDLHYLGEYETKERCIEIIDEIQELLVNNGRASDRIAQVVSGIKNEFIVYEMPQR